MYIDANRKDWDKYLQCVMLAYCTVIHSTIDMTPYEALFGQKPNLLQDMALQELKEDYANFDEFFVHLKEVLTKTILN